MENPSHLDVGYPSSVGSRMVYIVIFPRNFTRARVLNCKPDLLHIAIGGLEN